MYLPGTALRAPKAARRHDAAARRGAIDSSAPSDAARASASGAAAANPASAASGATAAAGVPASAPAAPVIDPSNGTTISGTAEAGATVTLTNGSGNPIGQVTADGSGNWSFTPTTPLNDGVHTEVEDNESSVLCVKL